MPAKLTQRDSGLADSIEPDSTESRRQSITPIPGYRTDTPETEGLAEQVQRILSYSPKTSSMLSIIQFSIDLNSDSIPRYRIYRNTALFRFISTHNP